MLDDMRAGWWAGIDDVQGIRQLFLDVAARGNSLLTEYQPDLNKIAQYERKVLAQRYARLLHSIVSGQPQCESQELATPSASEVG